MAESFEGSVRKGGVNAEPSQVRERPHAPRPITVGYQPKGAPDQGEPPTGGSSAMTAQTISLADHDRHVADLLHANNREIERRRKAEGELAEANALLSLVETMRCPECKAQGGDWDSDDVWHHCPCCDGEAELSLHRLLAYRDTVKEIEALGTIKTAGITSTNPAADQPQRSDSAPSSPAPHVMQTDGGRS